jgi:hypothetical protein
MALSPNQPLRIGFAAILLAIKARLNVVTSIPLTAVKLIGRSNTTVPNLTAERDVLVRASGFTIGPEEFVAGRIVTQLIRTVYVFPRVRMMRDQTDRDEVWLTDPAGIFALEEGIANGLHEWFPMDGDKNQLTTVGLKLVKGEGADKDIPAGKQVGNVWAGWGHSSLAFNAHYLPPIDPGATGILN